MSISGGLRFDFPDGREPVHLRFVINAADAEILRQFSAAAQAMLAAFSRAGGLSTQLHVSFQQGEAAQFKTEEPTDDQRAAILHHLRPLLLTKEPGSFDRTCGAVRRCSDHEFLGTHLRGLRDIYSGANLRDTIVISKGDLALNSEAAFQHWLNGFEYHREADRAAAVAGKGDLLSLEVVRPIFIMMLNEKIKAIVLLGQIIDKMLDCSVNNRR